MRGGYVDVLIVTALQDELEAVLELGDGGEAGWKRTKDRSGSTYHVREFQTERGKHFIVAAAWLGMIGAEGVKLRTEKLIEELDPSTIGMCGICTGIPGRVVQGDVLVADMIYRAELTTKIGHTSGKVFAHIHPISEHDLGLPWRIDAAFISRKLSLSLALQAAKPISLRTQKRWLLRRLLSREPTITDLERREHCPNWPDVIYELRDGGLLENKRGILDLTDAGILQAEEDKLLYPDWEPQDPSAQVYVGAMATVNRVVKAYSVEHPPKLMAIDMEAAALVELAHANNRRPIVVKGVADLQTDYDDDLHRKFASRASAECLLSILQKLFVPEERRVSNGPASRRDVFLENISIRNFKNIHQLQIEFAHDSELPGHWTCIAGLNGAGKSAVLQAVALVMLGERLATEIGGEWLARARRWADGDAHSADIRARVRVGQDSLELALPLGEKGIYEERLAIEPAYKELQAFWDRRSDQHILLSYGAGRNLSAFVDTRHATKSHEVRRQMTLFDPLTQVAAVDVLLKQGERVKPILAMLKRILDIVLEGVALSVEESDEGLQFHCGGAAVPASELPDGFRATIAWLADICSAWHDKAPDEAKDGDPSKIRGLVLIDEIDLHLHASLQRVLVPRLRKALPEVQWIVTTHSPLVVSSFDRREIVLLQPTDQGPRRKEVDRQILGFSTDEVYSYLMEVPPHSAALEVDAEQGPGGARLAQILAQSPEVSEKQAEEERALLDDLAKRLRSSDPNGDDDSA